MKKAILTIALGFLFNSIKAQDLPIHKIDLNNKVPVKGMANPDPIILEKKDVEKFKKEGDDKIKIEVINIPAKITVALANGTEITTDGSDSYFDITGAIQKAIENKTDKKSFKIQVKLQTGKVLDLQTIMIKWDKLQEDDSGDEVKIDFPKENISTFIGDNYKLKTTRLGLVATQASNSRNIGNDITHIFVDQYGNNIFSTIPQGVPERQYVVHVIYLAPAGGRNLIYAVNESKSGFNPQLTIQNADIRTLLGAGNVLASGTQPIKKTKKQDPIKYLWVDQEIVLSTSTDDIEFELFRVLVNKDTIYNFDKLKLGTFTIKMTPRYHVSMDVGLVRSNLKNPDYQLIQSPDDPTQKVVKEGINGNRGVVTLMATFYTSPVLLWKKYVKKRNVPAYKLSGRNYLDDHSLIERIYPAIGVGFTDKTLENLFVGVNWEIVRGGAFFIGVHYGKVNTFDNDHKLQNFEFSKTPTTEETFNLYKDQNWKTGFSFGAKVDVKIITSLFSPASNSNNQ